MIGKPALDDYFDALLGETSTAAQPEPPPQPPLPVATAAEVTPDNTAAAPQPAAPALDFAAPLGDPLDELEAVFEQAQAEARAAGVFDQASSAPPAPLAAPMGDPLDELEAVFEQAQAEARAAGVFNQASSAAAAPLAAPMGDPLDELEAVFEQAQAAARAAGVFDQAQSAGTPAKVELDELEAAFEAAAEAARIARAAGVAAAPPLPAHVPMPGPAEVPPQHGLLRPQLAKRSEAVRRRLARRHESTVPALPPVAVEKFHRWLRFQMAGQSYAVELLKVQEVQRVPDILPVRGAAPHVVGVMNLRGQIIAVIDLGTCIGLPHEPMSEASRVIVLETGEETVGLLVSAVAEVISLSERAVENPVSSIPALPREALIGIARHAGHMSVLLDATVFLR